MRITILFIFGLVGIVLAEDGNSNYKDKDVIEVSVNDTVILDAEVKSNAVVFRLDSVSLTNDDNKKVEKMRFTVGCWSEAGFSHRLESSMIEYTIDKKTGEGVFLTMIHPGMDSITIGNRSLRWSYAGKSSIYLYLNQDTPFKGVYLLKERGNK